MMQRTNMIKGYIYVIVSALIFGCMPLMAKFIYAEGVNPLTLVLLRNCLSLPILYLLARISGNSLKITPKALPSVSMIAVMGCCITPVLLFMSYQYIATGTATVFHFIYPAVVVLPEIVFLKKRMKAGNLVSLLLCIIGICLFYTPGESISLLGSTSALLSGVTYAIYILLLSSFRFQEISGFVFSFYVAAISSVLLLIFSLASGQLMLPVSLTGWLLSILFAVAVNVGAVVLFQRGTFLIGGQRASILSTVEPITGVVIGAAVFDEIIVLRTGIGVLFVIAASILIALFDMRNSKNDK